MFHIPSASWVKIYPFLIALVIAGPVTGAIIFSANETVSGLDASIKQWNVALSSWQTDCAAMSRPIEDCAFTWQKNGVLRQVYFAEVSHEE